MEAQLQRTIEMTKKMKLLKMHPYAISQMATGEWYTYLPPDDKGGKRIYRRRKTKEEIEDLVVKYWADQQDTWPTIEDLFNEALEERDGLVNKKGTIDRHRATFNKHFKDVKMKPMKMVKAYDIECFIYDQFKTEKGLTAKAWGRLRTVIDMILIKGRKHRLTTIRLTDILEDMQFKPASLMKKPEDGEKQKAYTVEELEKIIAYCRDSGKQTDLAIILLVYTGLRVGELCTLQNGDISDKSITISRALEHHKEGGRVVYGVQNTKTENQ